MTYRYAFVKWLGSASLVMAMTGCPGGDDGDTGAETSPVTTSVGNDSTTGEEATGTTAQATTMSAESTGEPDTSGGVTCDPPCDAGQECVGGACIDMPGDSTTGEPPMECGLAVQLQFPNPECITCAGDACCTELQTCFGDETMAGQMTECLNLNNCIVMNCSTAMSLMELQTCVDMSCMDFGASLNTWLAYQACLGMNCMAQCM